MLGQGANGDTAAGGAASAACGCARRRRHQGGGGHVQAHVDVPAVPGFKPAVRRRRHERYRVPAQAAVPLDAFHAATPDSLPCTAQQAHAAPTPTSPPLSHVDLVLQPDAAVQRDDLGAPHLRVGREEAQQPALAATGKDRLLQPLARRRSKMDEGAHRAQQGRVPAGCGASCAVCQLQPGTNSYPLHGCPPG